MENKILKNNNAFIITRKTEKLTTAIYLLTDFFDSRESLKWRLRTIALSFLSFVESLFHKDKNEGKVIQNNSEMLIEEILTLLGLARNAFLVSPMNFSILKEEYQLLLDMVLREMRHRGSCYDFEFPEKFFAAPFSTHSRAEREIKDKNFHPIESVKDTTVEYNGALSNELDIYDKNVPGYKKDIRRETIMKMARAKGEITIKDISYLMSGVSEKTIQRELLAMVAEGVLIKEGERRWSRYLLKKHEA